MDNLWIIYGFSMDYGDYMMNIWLIYGEYMDNLWIWLVVLNPSEKYEFVNWDDDIPNDDVKNKGHVPKHQPVIKCHLHGVPIDSMLQV